MAKRKMVSDAEANEIARLYTEEGKNTPEIGEMLGRDKSVIRKALIRKGVDLRTSGESKRFFSDNDAESIVAMYESGKSASEIARELGASHTTVSEFIKVNGALLRPNGHDISNEDIDQMKALYNTGESFEKIAQVYGVSWGVVRRRLIDTEIEIREGARRWSTNQHAFDDLSNEHAAYWHGFLYADGCTQDRHQSFLSLGLSPVDTEHIMKLRLFLQSDAPVTLLPPTHKTPNGSARVAFNGQHLVSRLQETGIVVGRGKIERVIRYVPESMMHHWLRGLFDGDGSAAKKYCEIMFCGEVSLMEFVRRHLATYAQTNPNLNIRKHSSIGSLRYKGSHNARLVADYLYAGSTVWLERKREIIDNWHSPRKASPNKTGQT
jgi:transposase-like protein